MVASVKSIYKRGLTGVCPSTRRLPHSISRRPRVARHGMGAVPARSEPPLLRRHPGRPSQKRRRKFLLARGAKASSFARNNNNNNNRSKGLEFNVKKARSVSNSSSNNNNNNHSVVEGCFRGLDGRWHGWRNRRRGLGFQT